MSAEIRLATGKDAAGIADIYGPIVASTPISFEIEPPDVPEIQRRIAQTQPAYPWLVYDYDGRIAGYAYASCHRVRAAYEWSVDTSVYVHPHFHRRGVGRGLYLSLFQILMMQGYFNAYAGITLPNPASVGLHESLGFKAVGVYRNVGHKLGVWYDVGWWHLDLLPPIATPRPPRSLNQIQTEPDWERILASGLSVIRG